MQAALRFPTLCSLLLVAAPSALAQWTTDQLSAPRYLLSATSVGQTALFAGGFTPGGAPSAVVDLYDTAAGTWSTASLSLARGGLTATSVGSLALFAGGDAPVASDVVDLYDASGGGWSTGKLVMGRSLLAAASVGTKAIFAGGRLASGMPSPLVDIYDAASGTWSAATLSQPRYDLAAASVGTKVLFAGGWRGQGPSARVDIYDDATGTWSTASLSFKRLRMAATTVGSKVIFAGGGTASVGISDVVDIYDDATGTWTATTLTATREYLAGTTVADQALFAGGWNGTLVAESAVVDLYDDGAGAWTTASLSVARWGLTATAVGNQAFFAGGSVAGDTVDVYTLQSGGPIGTNYCGPATFNSSGQPGVINASGSEQVALNDVTLEAAQLPANQFGFFLASLQQGFVANPGGSQGHLCLGGAIGRFNRAGEVLSSGAGGAFSLKIDLQDVPQPTGPVTVQPGEAWSFQSWFRDNNPMPTSNFTDGIEIQFQ